MGEGQDCHCQYPETGHRDDHGNSQATHKQARSQLPFRLISLITRTRMRTHAHTHRDLGPLEFIPRQADLNELSSWLPPFLKVFLTMLFLHLECQPGAQDALQGDKSALKSAPPRLSQHPSPMLRSTVTTRSKG